VNDDEDEMGEMQEGSIERRFEIKTQGVWKHYLWESHEIEEEEKLGT